MPILIKFNKMNNSKNHKKVHLPHLANMMNSLVNIAQNYNLKLVNQTQFKKIKEMTKYNQQKMPIAKFLLLQIVVNINQKEILAINF
jgi:hypothetical protein